MSHCICNFPIYEQVSWTPDNPGRRFKACPTRVSYQPLNIRLEFVYLELLLINDIQHPFRVKKTNVKSMDFLMMSCHLNTTKT